MTKKIIFILFLLAAITNGCKQKKNKTAEQTLREFYTLYITECAGDHNPDVISNIMECFVTKELIQKLEMIESDYDPFLHTQEYDKVYLEMLTIKPIAEQENTYSIDYKFHTTKNPINCVTLSLIEVGDKYLINHIDGLSFFNSEQSHTSDIRPDEQLELEKIYTDLFEFIDYRDGEYRDLIIVKKGNKEIVVFDNTNVSEDDSTISTLKLGDKIEIQWKLVRFYHEGGKKFYIEPFAEKLFKINWDSLYHEQISNDFENFKLFHTSDTITQDLNGDNIAEIIFFNESKKIIITDGSTNTESAFHDDDFNTFGWVDFWGITTDSRTWRILFKENADGSYDLSDDKIDLVYPSIFVRKYESGGGIITFDNEKYVWIHQND